MADPGRRRVRRRAVGPPGARPAEEPVDLGLGDDRKSTSPADDAERLRRDQPPHHDRGV